jgi:hypothetical protein
MTGSSAGECSFHSQGQEASETKQLPAGLAGHHLVLSSLKIISSPSFIKV